MAAAPAPLPAAVAGWWEYMNGSPACQDGIFYALAVLYGLVAATSFIFQHVILDLPGLAFFTTYAMLALFWAEILYQARGLITDGLRSGFITINGVVYALQMCFVAFDKEADLDVLDHPILNFIYYLLVEILPSTLVLYILRRIPSKLRLAQYQQYQPLSSG
ncbi:hypothetical protein PR202_ga02301 [Eleusine coracana subsp. coracana]|uniref:THH1/TOM1/TOM3 domain-containing protein n=1 Tax=Eleusine coracana subsp. coracana TaxID=191504 RepID=A0AAV5BLV7_ELECO|nr:hypothetical protein PR202_ga02301 [Eleusine coracana subsp. coracana]